ncbi:hypothetical protein DdX_18992 [Ditylenchus destructor]|uniref:Uncharacterized protein n=1 Tax=Ditylenchus destructor TaxID=166010 RepID=A0AAD4MJY3_9BILA|nr:hypothetical protein DdX_18992 [Ditylenchus destructor]
MTQASEEGIAKLRFEESDSNLGRLREYMQKKLGKRNKESLEQREIINNKQGTYEKSPRNVNTEIVIKLKAKGAEPKRKEYANMPEEKKNAIMEHKRQVDTAKRQSRFTRGYRKFGKCRHMFIVFVPF